MIQRRSTMEKEYSHLMSKIWEAEASLNTMRRKVSELQKFLQVRCPEATPPDISVLPVEVLGMIFKEAVALSDTDWEFPPSLFEPNKPEWPVTRPELLLSHVSRYWRAVAIGTPSLWTHIRFHVQQSSDLVDLYLTRSCGLPLDLAFRQHFVCGIHPRQAYAADYPRISDSILKHMHICRRLEIQTNVFFPELLEGLGRSSAPFLQEIILHHPRSNIWEPAFSTASFPSLTHLDLGELVSLSTAIPTKGLTSLTLSGVPAFGLPVTTFLNVLSELQSLTHLSLLDEAVDFDHTHTAAPVEIPSLLSLSLQPGPDISRLYLTGLLETVITPALEELILNFTNVSSPRELQLFLRTLKREAPRFPKVRRVAIDSPFEGFDIANALVHTAPNIECLSVSRYSIDSVLIYLTHDARREAFPKLRVLQLEGPHFDWDVLLAFQQKRKQLGRPLRRLEFNGFGGFKGALLDQPFMKILDACLDI